MMPTPSIEHRAPLQEGPTGWTMGLIPPAQAHTRRATAFWGSDDGNANKNQVSTTLVAKVATGE